MPLQQPALPLPAEARSAGIARSWVSDLFTRMGREDLVDAARLGVSELVTNAVLHGEAPISVCVRGTRTHPRIEVRDGSRQPPVMSFDTESEEGLLATIGRGLGMVAMNSLSWGADLVPGGKVVWFCPTDEPRAEGDLSGEVFEFEQEVLDRPPIEDENLVTIRLLDLPAGPWQRFQQRYFELARELRILVLVSGDSDPVARRFSELFLEGRRLGQRIRGREPLASLSFPGAEGRILPILELRIPAELPTVTASLLEELELVEDLCRREQMLAVAATPEEQRFIRWWFGEFVRQPAGGKPVSWPDYLADDSTRAIPSAG